MKANVGFKEWALSHVGYEPKTARLSFADVADYLSKNMALYLVRGKEIFSRGRKIEEKVLHETGDGEKAWNAAKPYYEAASLKNDANAWFRKAQCAKGKGWLEFHYAHYLEKAAKLGHEQAIQDFVYDYDTFKAKTITKDAYRSQKRQEKLFFECCEKLSAKGDLYARWELGKCYWLECGTRKNLSKSLEILEEVFQKVTLDAEEQKRRKEIIDYIKVCNENNW